MYERLLRPVLFRLDPERAHHLSIGLCEAIGRWRVARSLAAARFTVDDPVLRTCVAGIDFPNPLGLAAGYDKSGRAAVMLACLGFGHVEIGSVSARPSAGNPRPRLFRLERDRGIIVNYGLPNDGAEIVARRLRGRRFPVPVGVNLVKTNDPARPATLNEVLDDYARSLSALRGCGDYVCLNLSCPNTPDGRDFFADLSRLEALLRVVEAARPGVPVFLKLKPAEDQGYLRELLAVSRACPPVRGFQVNLPPGKPAGLRVTVSKSYLARRPGAVAGKPVEGIIDAALARLYRMLGPSSGHALVVAGGVFTGKDAYRKIRLGASLVQLYTALVYRGPAVAREVLIGLAALLKRDGYQHVSDAIGADVY